MAAPCTTEIECNCLFGFLNSGWNFTDLSTLNLVTDDKTIQRYPPTGSWIGSDAIVEYLSGYGGDFANEIVDLTPDTFDFSRSTAEECAFWAVGANRVETKVPFSGDVPICIDFTSTNFFKYKLFPDASPEEPSMIITEWDILTDDFFIAALFGALDTPATAEYTCEAILACEDDGDDDDDDDDDDEEQPPKTRTRRRERRGLKGKEDKSGGKKKKGKGESDAGKKKGGKKEGQQDDRMTACLEKLAALPPTADDGYHLDGNSRGCRILHGAYALTNTEHCPHISFEKEIDVNGLFKCYESSLVTNEDRFTDEQMDFFKSVPIPYDTPNPYLNFGPCDELPHVPAPVDDF